MMHNRLTTILDAKQHDVAKLHAHIAQAPTSELAQVFHGNTIFPRKNKNVLHALQYAEHVKVIAEIKRRSPSKGELAQIADPLTLAQQYILGGASAISVLTESTGFGGSLEDLKKISAAPETQNTPILRKDFLIDPIQIAESILYGADMILLIVAVLEKQLPGMLQKARELNIPALVEVHTREEIQQAIDAGAEIIGVNNRNLKTFDIDTQCAFELAEYLPKNAIKIAESGIFECELAREYHQAGYAAVLVGEALVKSVDPKKWLEDCKK